jgi:hypothetical protein
LEISVGPESGSFYSDSRNFFTYKARPPATQLFPPHLVLRGDGRSSKSLYFSYFTLGWAGITDVAPVLVHATDL